jgi:hypothetical protein
MLSKFVRLVLSVLNIKDTKEGACIIVMNASSIEGHYNKNSIYDYDFSNKVFRVISPSLKRKKSKGNEYSVKK